MNGKPLRVLHLEDDPRDSELVERMLGEEGIPSSLRRVSTRKAFEEALQAPGWEIILSDFSLPSFDGLNALALAREKCPGVPFILFSGAIGEEVAIQSLKGGATDYVLKQRPARLVSALRNALKEAEEQLRRKQAEAELVQSEERFKIVAQATNDVIWDWNLETGEIWRNDNFQKLFGYLPAASQGNLEFWLKQLHPEDKAAVIGSFNQAIRSGSAVWSGEYRYRRADGAYAFILDRAFVMRDPAGKAVRVIGAMTDLSSLKQAEEKLREQAALIDQAHDAISVRDMEDRIVYWNKSAERLYGWTAREAVGRNVRELLFREADPVQRAAELVLQQSEWAGELNQVTKQGKSVIVASRWTLLRDAQNRPKAKLIIDRDLTETKQLEAQFLRAQRMESIGLLAGGIAHDLNNALVPLLVGVSYLHSKPLDPEMEQFLTIMETSARRAAEMVKQVLAFARGAEGQQCLVEVDTLIREMEKIIKDTFPKTIDCQVKLSKPLWLVSGFATQLHQVLMNLCINARDAMPYGGRLTLTAENVSWDQRQPQVHPEAAPGKYLLITVTDTGIGMPPKVLDKIFQPLFTTKEPGKGTGLGLSTSLNIVKNHGGFLTVKSQVGRGSEFNIYLPACPGREAAAAETTQSLLPAGQGELILVIDDETAICEITKITLQNYGYQALVAGSGPEAVAIFAEKGKDIQLVLTDTSMPFMDGPATCIALRKMNPQLKIIVASGGEEGRESDEAQFPPKVNAFVQKPYTVEKLLSTISHVLSH